MNPSGLPPRNPMSTSSLSSSSSLRNSEVAQQQYPLDYSTRPILFQPNQSVNSNISQTNASVNTQMILSSNAYQPSAQPISSYSNWQKVPENYSNTIENNNNLLFSFNKPAVISPEVQTASFNIASQETTQLQGSKSQGFQPGASVFSSLVVKERNPLEDNLFNKSEEKQQKGIEQSPGYAQDYSNSQAEHYSYKKSQQNDRTSIGQVQQALKFTDKDKIQAMKVSQEISAQTQAIIPHYEPFGSTRNSQINTVQNSQVSNQSKDIDFKPSINFEGNNNNKDNMKSDGLMQNQENKDDNDEPNKRGKRTGETLNSTLLLKQLYPELLAGQTDPITTTQAVTVNGTTSTTPSGINFESKNSQYNQPINNIDKITNNVADKLNNLANNEDLKKNEKQMSPSSDQRRNYHMDGMVRSSDSFKDNQNNIDIINSKYANQQQPNEQQLYQQGVSASVGVSRLDLSHVKNNQHNLDNRSHSQFLQTQGSSSSHARLAQSADPIKALGLFGVKPNNDIEETVHAWVAPVFEEFIEHNFRFKGNDYPPLEGQASEELLTIIGQQKALIDQQNVHIQLQNDSQIQQSLQYSRISQQQQFYQPQQSYYQQQQQPFLHQNVLIASPAAIIGNKAGFLGENINQHDFLAVSRNKSTTELIQVNRNNDSSFVQNQLLTKGNNHISQSTYISPSYTQNYSHQPRQLSEIHFEYNITDKDNNSNNISAGGEQQKQKIIERRELYQQGQQEMQQVQVQSQLQDRLDSAAMYYQTNQPLEQHQQQQQQFHQEEISHTNVSNNNNNIGFKSQVKTPILQQPTYLEMNQQNQDQQSIGINAQQQIHGVQVKQIQQQQHENIDDGYHEEDEIIMFDSQQQQQQYQNQQTSQKEEQQKQTALPENINNIRTLQPIDAGITLNQTFNNRSTNINQPQYSAENQELTGAVSIQSVQLPSTVEIVDQMKASGIIQQQQQQVQQQQQQQQQLYNNKTTEPTSIIGITVQTQSALGTVNQSNYARDNSNILDNSQQTQEQRQIQQYYQQQSYQTNNQSPLSPHKQNILLSQEQISMPIQNTINVQQNQQQSNSIYDTQNNVILQQGQQGRVNTQENQPITTATTTSGFLQLQISPITNIGLKQADQPVEQIKMSLEGEEQNQHEQQNSEEEDEMLLDDLTPFHDPITSFPKNNERELQAIQTVETTGDNQEKKKQTEDNHIITGQNKYQEQQECVVQVDGQQGIRAVTEVDQELSDDDIDDDDDNDDESPGRKLFYSRSLNTDQQRDINDESLMNSQQQHQLLEQLHPQQISQEQVTLDKDAEENINEELQKEQELQQSQDISARKEKRKLTEINIYKRDGEQENEIVETEASRVITETNQIQIGQQQGNNKDSNNERSQEQQNKRNIYQEIEQHIQDGQDNDNEDGEDDNNSSSEDDINNQEDQENEEEEENIAMNEQQDKKYQQRVSNQSLESHDSGAQQVFQDIQKHVQEKIKKYDQKSQKSIATKTTTTNQVVKHLHQHHRQLPQTATVNTEGQQKVPQVVKKQDENTTGGQQQQKHQSKQTEQSQSNQVALPEGHSSPSQGVPTVGWKHMKALSQTKFSLKQSENHTDSKSKLSSKQDTKQKTVSQHSQPIQSVQSPTGTAATATTTVGSSDLKKQTSFQSKKLQNQASLNSNSVSSPLSGRLQHNSPAHFSGGQQITSARQTTTTTLNTHTSNSKYYLSENNLVTPREEHNVQVSSSTKKTKTANNQKNQADTAMLTDHSQSRCQSPQIGTSSGSSSRVLLMGQHSSTFEINLSPKQLLHQDKQHLLTEQLKTISSHQEIQHTHNNIPSQQSNFKVDLQVSQQKQHEQSQLSQKIRALKTEDSASCQGSAFTKKSIQSAHCMYAQGQLPQQQQQYHQIPGETIDLYGKCREMNLQQFEESKKKNASNQSLGYIRSSDLSLLRQSHAGSKKQYINQTVNNSNIINNTSILSLNSAQDVHLYKLQQQEQLMVLQKQLQDEQESFQQLFKHINKDNIGSSALKNIKNNNNNNNNNNNVVNNQNKNNKNNPAEYQDQDQQSMNPVKTNQSKGSNIPDNTGGQQNNKSNVIPSKETAKNNISSTVNNQTAVKGSKSQNSKITTTGNQLGSKGSQKNTENEEQQSQGESYISPVPSLASPKNESTSKSASTKKTASLASTLAAAVTAAMGTSATGAGQLTSVDKRKSPKFIDGTKAGVSSNTNIEDQLYTEYIRDQKDMFLKKNHDQGIPEGVLTSEQQDFIESLDSPENRDKFKQFMQRNHAWVMEKQRKIQKQHEENHYKQMKECTFKPLTNSSNPVISPPTAGDSNFLIVPSTKSSRLLSQQTQLKVNQQQAQQHQQNLPSLVSSKQDININGGNNQRNKQLVNSSSNTNIKSQNGSTLKTEYKLSSADSSNQKYYQTFNNSQQSYGLFVGQSISSQNHKDQSIEKNNDSALKKDIDDVLGILQNFIVPDSR